MADANTERMMFMLAHGLTHCEWDEHGRIVSATRSPEPVRTVQAQPGPRAARDLAATIQARRKYQHDVAFAHTSVRPKLEDSPESVVPRAVRAKQDTRGRTEVG